MVLMSLPLTLCSVSMTQFDNLMQFAEILQYGEYTKACKYFKLKYIPPLWRRWILGERPETRYCFWGLYMAIYLPDKGMSWETLYGEEFPSDLLSFFTALNDHTPTTFPEMGKILAQKLQTTIRPTRQL